MDGARSLRATKADISYLLTHRVLPRLLLRATPLAEKE
jgi:hypothetical protein